ncbi:hypothetical protein ACOMHN_061403 [Nucella lapillus]
MGKDQATGQGRPASKKTGKSAKKDDKEAAEHQRKSEFESKLRMRVESEAKAFDIVNRLIEPNITAEFLLQACQFINHNHYEDIMEERFISHICGYPLCSNTLRQVTKKKYHISTKSNTVYDISERKKFCSNRCYHASEHLREQIPQTPVWSRRGADPLPFDLLQQDTSSCEEGKKVIGGRTFGLREELTLLERMDRMEESASRTRTPGPATHDRHTSLEENQRLSNQLKSLSTEDDMETGMRGLSLHAGQGAAEPCGERGAGIAGDAGQGISKGESGQKGHKTEDTDGKGSGQQKAGGEKVEKEAVSVQREEVALESSMKDLTRQDRVEANSVDSDDDGAGDGMGGGSKSQRCDQPKETHNSNRTQTDTLSQEGVDSDDDDVEEEGAVGSVIEVTESDSLSTSQGSVTLKTGTHCSHSAETDSKAEGEDPHKLGKEQKGTALKQQPGESKSAYLMRLLDQRRNMLSKVADVQSGVSDISKSSHSKTTSSTGTNSLEGKSDKVQSTELDGKEDTDSRYRSEKLSRGEEQTLRTSEPSRKKKSAQTREKPSTNKSKVQTSPLGAICDHISAWLSAETLDYLGLNSKGDGSESNTFHKDPEIQRKYQDLCLRLAHQDKDFGKILGEEEMDGDVDRKGVKKPLPLYEELKEETQEFQQRVQHFMGGSLTIKSKPTKVEVEGERGENADSGEKGDGGGRLIVLPDVDSHNQLLIRRRIILEQLDRTMPSLLLPLGLSVQDISAPLRELVFTFSLTSHNILLRPVEWTLAAIILLKMLERNIVKVRTALSVGAFSLVLGGLGQSPASLGHLVHDMLLQRSQALGGRWLQSDIS